LPNSAAHAGLNQAEDFPRYVLRLFQNLQLQNQHGGEQQGRTMNPLIQLKQTPPVFLVALLLACFAIPQSVHAVVPAPDGGYPNFTTAEGDNALKSLTAGFGNTAVGTFSLFSVTTGNFNTALGAGSLDLNLGDSNTAVGGAALLLNTTGTQNTAVGTATLEFNDTGSNNTANGAFALFFNTIGTVNTAIGDSALLSNTEGTSNTAMGASALFTNTTGSFNTANGFIALSNNTAGESNTATGVAALFHNTAGNSNTANGFNALNNNTTGNANTAIGNNALFANTVGSNNIALGFSAGSSLITGDNNIDIGASGVAFEADTIRVGVNQIKTFIAGIRGVQTGVADAVNVLIDSDGQLGTMSSSRRFKKEIKPMDSASESILALKPVIFHYKSDRAGTPQFGLVAEEVAEVDPDLVVRDENGEIYTVRYDQVNAMLLNEFLKEHRKVQDQQATITELKSTVVQQQKDFQATAAHQQKQIEALTAGLRDVSAQIQLSKPVPQIAENNQ